MNWLEELMVRERTIREQFAGRCTDPDSLKKHINHYHTVVEAELCDKSEVEDTALRYALRLKFPFLNHLTALYPETGSEQ